jgi:hypothetical protein
LTLQAWLDDLLTRVRAGEVIDVTAVQDVAQRLGDEVVAGLERRLEAPAADETEALLATLDDMLTEFTALTEALFAWTEDGNVAHLEQATERARNAFDLADSIEYEVQQRQDSVTSLESW